MRLYVHVPQEGRASGYFPNEWWLPVLALVAVLVTVVFAAARARGVAAPEIAAEAHRVAEFTRHLHR